MNSNTNLVDDLDEILGTRSTRSQRAVVRTMSLAPGELLTHAELLLLLENGGEAMDRVTLYRTLDKLVLAGVLNSLVDDSRVTRFVLCEKDFQKYGGNRTAHFECKGCRKMFPLVSKMHYLNNFFDNADELAELAGHLPMQIDVAIRGICSHCASG